MGRCYLSLIVGLFLASCMTATKSESGALSSELLTDIQKAEAENNVLDRRARTEDMLKHMDVAWKSGDLKNAGERVIDALIPLLNDDDDIVRSNAAVALGDFGPRAKKAVPALIGARERYLNERAKTGLVISPPIDSVAFIQDALHRIEGTK